MTRVCVDDYNIEHKYIIRNIDITLVSTTRSGITSQLGTDSSP